MRSVFFWSAPADEDGQVLRQRAGGQQGVVEPVEPARVAEALAVEQAAHDLDGLVQPVETLAHGRPEVDPEGLVLPREPGPADPEDRPPAGHVVQRRRELGRVTGVAEGVRPDHQPHAHPRGPRRDRAHREPALQDRLLPRPEDRVQVVPGPDGVPAGFLGGDCCPDESGPVRRLAPELGPELDVGHTGLRPRHQRPEARKALDRLAVEGRRIIRR